MKRTSTRRGILLLTVIAATSLAREGARQAEDPLDTILAILRHARNEGREAMALGDVRAILSAQATYKTFNHYYDDLSCLARPRDCRPDYPEEGPALLDSALTSLEARGGYRREFHRGARPDADAIRGLGASPTSTEGFAYTATPESPDEGGRSFCGDDTGRLCFAPAGSAPSVRNGRCTRCEEIPVQGLGSLWRSERPKISPEHRDAILAALDTDERLQSWPEAQKAFLRSDVESYVVSSDEPLRIPPPPPRPRAEPVRVGGNVKPPRQLVDVDPVYPELAQKARVQGVVLVECEIDTDGKVSSAQVLRSVPLLDEAALEAVRQWVYEPTLVDGAPVPLVMTVTVTFSLE